MLLSLSPPPPLSETADFITKEEEDSEAEAEIDIGKEEEEDLEKEKNYYAASEMPSFLLFLLSLSLPPYLVAATDVMTKEEEVKEEVNDATSETPPSLLLSP